MVEGKISAQLIFITIPLVAYDCFTKKSVRFGNAFSILFILKYNLTNSVFYMLIIILKLVR